MRMRHFKPSITRMNYLNKPTSMMEGNKVCYRGAIKQQAQEEEQSGQQKEMTVHTMNQQIVDLGKRLKQV
jgi:hypothetical protein